MKDKEIREILISYLRASGNEMRIYQEKAIGNAICDVLVVMDELIGYEIKSDSDTYTRLPKQIDAYNRFCDKNYIVVGKSHLRSVEGRVPESWGIICIDEGSITTHRIAKNNNQVSRRAQLSILWKLELKNILMKNDMPLYAQKPKDYIAKCIMERVDEDILKKQIACELLHRDYSVFEGVQDFSIYADALPRNIPAQEIIDVLSENNLDDFTLDKWIELYRQARELQEHKDVLFVEKPKEPRVEHEIRYDNIEVSLGAPWIGVNIINDFLDHIVNYQTDKENYRFYDCKYEHITGNWYIQGKRNTYYIYRNKNLTVRFGTKRYNALYVIEATLNLREIKLLDGYGKCDEKETIAALEKQKKIEEEFREWIWQDEDRIWEVEDAYNKLFSGFGKEKYDGSSLEFEGMSLTASLYPYQKDAVQRILKSKNTLLAFDVGAGKTYIMIAAAMKMRDDGISRRNMFVVPNHIVGQWEKIFTELYPSAKVLAIDPKMFKPGMREKVLNQIKEGDYDGVIIAYSCFEQIPISENIVLDNMHAQIERINVAINDVHTSASYSRWNKEILEKEKEKIVKMTKEFIKTLSYTGHKGVCFDDLEINTIFLDEAHNYKNLPITTKLKNLNCINTKGSKKCLDMLHKVRCVQNSEAGRGAVFATGTPLSNSISDAYAMQMYLQYEELEKSHLDVFDNWVKTFAKPEQLMEIDVNTSKYRMIRRFVRFHNLPELSKMFSQIAAFYAIDNDEELPEFGGYTDIVIKRYPGLTGYMMDLCKRTEQIRKGKINPRFDNMLKVSTDGRKAALDLRLVGEVQPFNHDSKVYNCIQNVMRIYRKYEGLTQLIFLRLFNAKGRGF